MPELPDILAYVDALAARIDAQPLREVRVLNPFVLRTVDPAPADMADHVVRGVGRSGKRIIISLDDELFIVMHLMIAGRLRWFPAGGKAKLPGRISLATFGFDAGTLVLTEAGSTRRASLSLLRGADGLAAFDRGGLDVLAATRDQFAERLLSENHTLKRALTDPRLLDGIGNAYSDEILHRARLSPVLLTSRMSAEQITALFDAAGQVLREWIDRLGAEAAIAFPERVTAFRPDMAVHGRYGLPCPDCGAPVQRIRYATNETNYCARCQNGGRLLADRALSRLLKQDWPRSIDEL